MVRGVGTWNQGYKWKVHWFGCGTAPICLFNLRLFEELAEVTETVKPVDDWKDISTTLELDN